LPAPQARPVAPLLPNSATKGALPSGAPGTRFFDSPFNQALAVTALVTLAVIQNGYITMRFDHVVQLPYLLMDWEPGLYARDWYLQSDPHDRIRFFHLLFIRLAAAPLGLEGGILFLHLLFLGATFWTWLLISKRLFGTAANGVVVGVLAIFFNGWELGANHLVESIFIPRMEAYTLCYAGLALLLGRRPIFAGLAFAAGGLFQPAVPLQFAGVVALWILIAGERPRLQTFVRFSAAYWVVSLPWMLFLRGTVVGESGLSQEEIIRIFAWIRHPAHMIPSTWEAQRWLASAALLLAFAAAWPCQRISHPALWRLGWTVPLIVVILAVSTVFIELMPLRWVVLFQPYRVSVLLYLILFLVLSPRLIEYARGPEVVARVRAAALLVSVVDPRLLLPSLLLELVLTAARQRKQPVQPRLEVMLWSIVVLGTAAFYPWMRLSVALGVIIAAGLLLPRLRPALDSPAGLRRLFMAAAASGVLALVLFVALPWEKWMARGEGGRYNAADRLLMRYQLKVIPVPAIERLGVWIREHTERDALFIIPPDRQQWGFRLFARRAQVFDVKSIPYAPPGIEAWWLRSLHHRGIFDPDDPANAPRMTRAWDDADTAGIGDDYANLSADEMARLAELYTADYVISPAAYDDARLELLRSEPAPEHRVRSKTLYLYRVAKSGNASPNVEAAAEATPL
jgi:hypothetical protein